MSASETEHTNTCVCGCRKCSQKRALQTIDKRCDDLSSAEFHVLLKWMLAGVPSDVAELVAEMAVFSPRPLEAIAALATLATGCEQESE